MPLVVDISHHQGRLTENGRVADTIDFDEMIMLGGVVGFIVRTSIGNIPDSLYLEWMNQILPLGVPFGNYHFLTSGIPGDRQCDNFLTVRKEGVLDDWLDVETVNGVCPSREEVREFRAQYVKRTGKPIGIYTNYSTWFERIGLIEGYSNVKLWIANFEKEYGSLESPAVPAPWDGSDWGSDNRAIKMWQYGAYKIPGYDRVIDHNAWHGSQEEFFRLYPFEESPGEFVVPLFEYPFKNDGVVRAEVFPHYPKNTGAKDIEFGDIS